MKLWANQYSKGKHDSPETRLKKSLSHIGVRRPPEVLAKISATRRRLQIAKGGICRLCKNPMTEADMQPSDFIRMNWMCKICDRKRGMETKRRIKKDVMEHYGGKCTCLGCEESCIEFLTMDHPNGDGAEQDRKLGRRLSGHAFYSWIRVNNYPSDFRILCFNCNCSRGAYGYCPHEKNRSL